ncbi:MAG: response regulator [Pelobacteraceae bacterium]
MTSHEIQHASASSNNRETETHRVLIVDDEPAICFAYRKLLESERFGFDICEHVEAGIAHLSRTDYFAVISDVRFAGSENEDGVYFMSVVRKAQPQAKVILVTGYGSDELKKTAHELGAYRYFEKPVNPSMILSLLRTLHLAADEDEEIRF